jgi:iron complex transport system permease protein
MKIVIDVDKLLHEGRINREEYDRLKSLARHETGSLAFNILIAFGVVATAIGVLALIPAGGTALVLGLVLSTAGVLLSQNYKEEWGLLGTLLLLVGAITTSGGVLVLTSGSLMGFLAVAVLLMAAAVTVKSGLLATLSVLSLTAAAGGETGYWHAEYMVAIYHPTLTVGVFSLLSLTAYVLSKSLSRENERLAIIVARTALFVVNLGFWIGSLWGDDPSNFSAHHTQWSATIGPKEFVVAWALGLLATGIWAAWNNRRWVVNTVAVFAAIHFYTQYFELLGPHPVSILCAGLFALAIALGLFRYNGAQRLPFGTPAAEPQPTLPASPLPLAGANGSSPVVE